MHTIIKSFKKGIIYSLLFFMAVLILISTFELVLVLVNELTHPIKESGIVLSSTGLIKVFGLFFNVLIGFELFETIELYLDDGTFHGEIILMIGIVAVARKVIVLDFTKQDPILIIALGLMVGFFSLGYYLIKHKRIQKPESS